MQRTDTANSDRHLSPATVATWAANGLATLLTALAIASGVIGLLVAFGRIGDSSQPFNDGLVWLTGAVLLAVAANVFRREHSLVDTGAAYASRPATHVPATPRSAAYERERERDIDEIAGMIVVATAEAREVGTVKDVLFDPKQLAVLGLMVAPEGVKDARMFVGREHIRGFGRDAVTIGSEADLQGFATRSREREVAASGTRLEGLRVMTASGDDVGKVTVVRIHPDATLARIEASRGLLRRSRKIGAADVVSIGRDRLIVTPHER